MYLQLPISDDFEFIFFFEYAPSGLRCIQPALESTLRAAVNSGSSLKFNGYRAEFSAYGNADVAEKAAKFAFNQKNGSGGFDGEAFG